jgi:hypothetical protein
MAIASQLAKRVRPIGPVATPHSEVPTYDLPYCATDGRLIMDKALNQDMSIWITQGAVSDRTAERPGSSEKGVILFRHILEDNPVRLARGDDPMDVIRDATQNQIISLEAEGGSGAGLVLFRDMPRCATMPMRERRLGTRCGSRGHTQSMGTCRSSCQLM